jgi:hypothetical protein
MTVINYGAAPATAAATKRRSFFKRILDAVIDARMEQARREISRHLHLVPVELLKQTPFFESIRERDGASSRL